MNELEELKKRTGRRPALVPSTGQYESIVTLSYGDYRWLVNQVEELEIAKNIYYGGLDSTLKQIANETLIKIYRKREEDMKPDL